VSIIIVATLKPVPEQRAEVIDILEKLIPTVHANDSGCELYALHEGEDRLVFLEKWATMEDIQAHGGKDVFQKAAADLDGKLSEPMDVQILQSRPAGDAKLGAI
jgi:quinol monooxygenase YgiN